MKATLLLFSMLMLLTGCQQYPDQKLKDIGGEGGPGVCPQFKYMNNISIQINTNSDLPLKLSGGVNSKLAIDECAFGTNASDYTIVKNSPQSVTIGIYVENNRHLNRELFDSNGKPKENALVHFKLSGRAKCSDREATVHEFHRVLHWEPVYASGKECGISGYTAIVQ